MQVSNLYYQHHKSAPFLFKDLSFALEENKINALHGKNGVGKSVLLNVLSSQVPHTALVSGHIQGFKDAFLVNQRFDNMIADQFSFEDNLKFAHLSKYPKPFFSLPQPLLYSDILDQFNIDIKTPAFKLSGGQRQMLSLLMVLQKKISILLLDEPTATLDENNARTVFQFLHTLTKKNITLLIVCHDKNLIDEHTTGQHLHLGMPQ